MGNIPATARTKRQKGGLLKPAQAPAPTPCLHQIFERSARLHRDSIAIEVPRSHNRPRVTRLTYAEVEEQANILAQRLREFVEPETIVAIFLPRTTPDIYVAQLAVLKAGAAYTCLDPNMPGERIDFILGDADPSAVITCRALKEGLRAAHSDQSRPLIVCDGPQTLVKRDTQMRDQPVQANAQNMAYVIYTSGTTGVPKGVVVEHRNIVTLIESDMAYFDLSHTDRVAQSSSTAYDSSIEEIYLAFSVGATLVLADDDVVRLGPDLIDWLQRQRITVLCPPPTLLRTTGCTNPEKALPMLRLLYVGGEALPTDLADLWSSGRWMVNGYGPTECAVTVSRDRVQPGKPITIGWTVTGNDDLILNENLDLAGSQEAGELAIRGPSVARGYLNRPELTEERFVDHPVHGRIYRTGDLVKRDDQGRLVYLGRIDSQVKIRGHRVELTEIEACICENADVDAAACRMQGNNARQQLVAFVVVKNGKALDAPCLRAHLSRKLPSYMVPTRFSTIDSLPVNTSGKLDRDSLPDIHFISPETYDLVEAHSAIEKRLATAFTKHLGLHGAISIHDDFFALGGDSLLAALVISELRTHSDTQRVHVRDLYERRTVAALAQHIELSASDPEEDAAAIERSEAPSPLAAGILQMTWLSAVLVLTSLAFYLLGFGVMPWCVRNLGMVSTLLLTPIISGISAALYAVLSIMVAVAAKRLLIGQYRPGTHEAWSNMYLRNWIVQRCVRLFPWRLVSGTELTNSALRLLGARIGKRVHIHRGVNFLSGGWDLLEIGDGAVINRDAGLRMIDYESQKMVIGPIQIGAGATLEIRSGMAPYTSLGEGSVLSHLSMIPSHTSIGANLCAEGIPAQSMGTAPACSELPAAAQQFTPVSYAFYLFTARIALLSVNLLPLCLGLWFATAILGIDEGRIEAFYLDGTNPFGNSLSILMASAAAGLAFGLLSRAICVRALGRIPQGLSARYSLTTMRFTLKNDLVESAGEFISGTLFWPKWLKAAGMKVGHRCEVSSIMEVVPELVSLDEDCFLADGIYLGAPAIRGEAIRFDQTTLSKNTFLGNHVVIPAGAQLPQNLLLGICTVAQAHAIKEDTAWFGHPSFELPRREVVAFDRTLTHEPSWLRYISRLFWETARFALPILPIFLFITWLQWSSSIKAEMSTFALYAFGLPVLTLGVGALLCLATVALKWFLLGRMKAGQHALWSCWCSRWDFLYVAWAQWARRAVSALEGTPLINHWLRLMGCRIGRRVFLPEGFAQVVDPDMLHFHDESTVTSMFQAHSFEDRVLKLAPVHIQKGATVRTAAVVMYGADIGPYASVAEQSVVMKHESLLPNRSYIGSPSQQANHTHNSVSAGNIPKPSRSSKVHMAAETELMHRT